MESVSDWVSVFAAKQIPDVFSTLILITLKAVDNKIGLKFIVSLIFTF